MWIPFLIYDFREAVTLLRVACHGGSLVKRPSVWSLCRVFGRDCVMGYTVSGAWKLIGRSYREMGFHCSFRVYSVILWRKRYSYWSIYMNECTIGFHMGWGTIFDWLLCYKCQSITVILKRVVISWHVYSTSCKFVQKGINYCNQIWRWFIHTCMADSLMSLL